MLRNSLLSSIAVTVAILCSFTFHSKADAQQAVTVRGGTITCSNCSGGGSGTNTTPSSQTISTLDTSTTSSTGMNSVAQITGTPTANSFANFAVSGASGGTFTITGTWVGSLQVESSFDASCTTYVPTATLQRGTSVQTSQITGNGVFSVDLTSANCVRVRATAYTSGTVTVAFTYSPAAGMTKLLNGVQLRDSAGNDVSNTTNHTIKVEDDILATVLANTLNFTGTMSSGTLGSAGVFTQVLAAGTTGAPRHSCTLQNTSSDTELVYFGTTGSATSTNTFQVLAGQPFSCSSPNGVVEQAAMSVAGKSSASDTYVLDAQ